MLDVSEGGFDTVTVPEGGSPASFAHSRSRTLHPPSVAGGPTCWMEKDGIFSAEVTGCLGQPIEIVTDYGLLDRDRIKQHAGSIKRIIHT